AGIETIRQMRRACPDAFIVVGGSHFTWSAVDALTHIPEVDAVVMGEGERTFLELLDRLPGREGFAEVLGLAWRDADGQIVVNERRPAIQDIDSLPLPAWDLFGPQVYSQRASMIGRNPYAGEQSLVTGVMTTRGCPQQCLFCANGIPTKIRYMSPNKAVDQFQWLQRTYGVTGLDILDDNFYASESHVVALCEEMLRRNCNFTWWAGLRLKNLSEDVLQLMKRAGCRSVSFGVETGTDDVLKTVRKNVTVAEMLEAMQRVTRVGFDRIDAFLIVGLPGETTDTIDRTVAFLRTLREMVGSEAWEPASIIGQLPLIFPGTGLEPLGRTEGSLPEDFSWSLPYREPKRYLPLINHRYDTVPHFASRQLPLEVICSHVGRHYWDELTNGRKRRYRYAPLRRAKIALGLG
ncbi:MAG: B12-binding domain-containing radical SAM protein, partial [Planctomycetota bacterium]